MPSDLGHHPMITWIQTIQSLGLNQDHLLEKRECTKGNQTESINYSELESEDDDLNSEERFTTSHASYPTIDLTSVEMSECDINNEPPSEEQCDINEKPKSLKNLIWQMWVWVHLSN